MNGEQLRNRLLQLPEDKRSPVIPFDFTNRPYLTLDLSQGNQELAGLDYTQEQALHHYVFGLLSSHGCVVGVGGYNEDRQFYSFSPVFGDQKEQVRSVHLGIDLWASAGMPVLVPYAGTIHSFKDNSEHGDYGPTIILQHDLGGQRFYSLYGHLSRSSLKGLCPGQELVHGQTLGYLGEYHENVHWPPHLHFQLIVDLEGREGDYPGVAYPHERAHYLANCPNPNWLLQIPDLPA